MAKNSTAVMDFLNNLWSYALPKAKAEAAELQKLMDKEGKGEKLEAWDWWYYTEKLRKEKIQSRRRRNQALLQAGKCTRRRLCRCQQALWHHTD